MNKIDLRSDTVTLPTAAMRRASKAASVGDAGRGEDRTVAELEELAAGILGKEAGVFLPSGTMGNLIAQLVYVEPGQTTYAGRMSHVGFDERASHTLFASRSVSLVDETSEGIPNLDVLRVTLATAVTPRGGQGGPRLLVSMENTHARSMGQPVDASAVEAVADITHAYGAKLHVDGARLFNAAVALGIPASSLVRTADSVVFSLSKGLSCPVGSVLVGTADFVARARDVRKTLGGAMRQAGIVAAAGLLALRAGPDGMIDRLAEDHVNARLLAEGLADLELVDSPGGIAQPAPGRLDPQRVRTNFVIFRVRGNRSAFINAMSAQGVLLMPYGHDQIRAVTHAGISRSDIEAALSRIGDAATSGMA